MSINCIKREAALAFLQSHDLPRVENTPHEIRAYGECFGPTGDEYVEREDFLPDIYGLFDLNAIRNWLGY